MKFPLPICMLSIAACASATEISDTIAVVENPAEITVIQSPEGFGITVNGCKDDASFRLDYETLSNTADDEAIEDWFIKPPFAKSPVTPKPRRNPCFEGFRDAYGGLTLAAGSTAGGYRTGYQVGFLNIVDVAWSLSKHGTRLALGLGLQYADLPVAKELTLIRSHEGALLAVPVPEGHYDSKATIKTFSVQIPLLLCQRIYRGFAVEFGAIGMLNTHTTADCSWKEDGDISSKTTLKHLHQRILTFDTFMRIGWLDNIAVYARYSPLSGFNKEFGPQYRTVSIGLSIGF